jgi:hypothetical protein
MKFEICHIIFKEFYSSKIFQIERMIERSELEPIAKIRTSEPSRQVLLRTLTSMVQRATLDQGKHQFSFAPELKRFKA